MVSIISYIIFIVSLLLIVQSSSITINSRLGKCLSDLTTQEFSNSYNYLQLSSKFGTKNAYPGFSSLFIKLSDDDVSKAHDIIKFLSLRKYQHNRLINLNGVKIRNEITNIKDIHQGLIEARNQNGAAWKIVVQCHQEAINVTDANVQDYLESHILNYHIKIDKLFEDFQYRLNNASISEMKLITFMLDEELLNTYDDYRKDIFS